MRSRLLRPRLLLLALAVLGLHLLLLRHCATPDGPPPPAAPPPAVLSVQTAPPQALAPPPAAAPELPAPVDPEPPAPAGPGQDAAPPATSAPRPAASPASMPVAKPPTRPRPPRPADPPPPAAPPVPAATPLAPAAPAAEAGERPAAAAPVREALAPLPPTRIPPPTRWSYRLSRGGLIGEGSLDWAPGPQGYTLALRGELPLIGTVLTQVSRGGFDAAGLAPLRFTDRRLRRPEQAANFRREAGQPLQVSFSGPSAVHSLPPGSQDRLSVMVQIAALAAAWTQPPESPFVLHVVGARGDLAEWHLRVIGEENLRLVGGETVRALKLLREPDGEHDTRAELWLDPAHGHLPIRIRLSDGRGEPLDLLRKTGEAPAAPTP